MGVSGGSKSTSGSAQKWAQPFAVSAAQTGQDLFNQNQPALNQLSQQVSGMIPGLNSAFEANGAMIRGNAGQLNGMVPQLQNAFGTNYNNMQDLAGAVNNAGGMAMADYAGQDAPECHEPGQQPVFIGRALWIRSPCRQSHKRIVGG